MFPPLNWSWDMENSTLQGMDNISAELTTTVKIWNCPKNYQSFMLTLYVYLLPCLIIFGWIGNSLAFVVFWRQRKDQSGEESYLLRCLAVVDNFYLMTPIFSRLLPTIAKYYNKPSLFWSIYFRPYAYVIAPAAEMMASYTLVIVTAHRYMLIAYPIKTTQWMSTAKIALTLVITANFCVAYNIPRLFQVTVDIRYNTCLGGSYPTLVRTNLGNNYLYNLLYKNLARVIFPTFIPLASQFLLTIAIKRRLQNRPAASRTQTMLLAHVLVVVSVVFLVCKIPASINSVLLCVMVIADIKNTQLENFRSYFIVICNMLLTVNSAVNFIVYLICSSKFKQTLRQLVPFCPCQNCRKKPYMINE